jgi:ferredoxin
MGAIKESVTKGEPVIHNINKCIGCGLCVTTCPQKAKKLIMKPEQQRVRPPEKGKFMKSSKDIEDRIHH